MAEPFSDMAKCSSILHEMEMTQGKITETKNEIKELEALSKEQLKNQIFEKTATSVKKAIYNKNLILNKKKRQLEEIGDKIEMNGKKIVLKNEIDTLEKEMTIFMNKDKTDDELYQKKQQLENLQDCLDLNRDRFSRLHSPQETENKEKKSRKKIDDAEKFAKEISSIHYQIKELEGKEGESNLMCKNLSEEKEKVKRIKLEINEIKENLSNEHKKICS